MGTINTKYKAGDYVALNKTFVVPELAGTVGIIHAVFADNNNYYSVMFPEAVNCPLDPTSVYAVMEHCLDPIINNPTWEV